MIHWLVAQVWPNIVASALWAVPGYFWGRHHMKRLHSRLDYNDAKLKKIHKDIKDA